MVLLRPFRRRFRRRGRGLLSLMARRRRPRRRSAFARKRRRVMYRRRRKPRKISDRKLRPGKMPIPTVVNELRRQRRHVVTVWRKGGVLLAPSGEVSTSSYATRLNDYYDPEYKDGGESPYDYAYWNNRYRKYRVNAVKFHIKFEIGSGATLTQPVGYYVVSSAEVASAAGVIGETVPIPGNEAQWYTLSMDSRIAKAERNMGGYQRHAGDAAVELTGFIHTNKYAGIPRGQKNTGYNSSLVVGDNTDPFCANMGNHPLRSHYLVLYTRLGQHQGTTTTVAYTLTITYFMTFWDRRGGVGWDSTELDPDADIVDTTFDTARVADDAPDWDTA